MKAFWKRHRKVHLWLMLDLTALAVFFLLRPYQGIMARIVAVMAAVRIWIGGFCYRTEVSVMEVLCALLAAFVALYLLVSAVAIARGRGRRRQRCYTAALGAVCTALTIYAGFCWLWGVNYYVDGFQQRSGIVAQAVAPEDLEAVTRYFADRLGETADTVARDEDGLFAVERSDILARSVHAYDAAAEQFPFLAFDDQPPKAVRFSRVMSALDFTGVYCPYTGESNVNVDSPACLLPATAAHELAHQRGVASEQECNFLAILAGTTCSMADYAYSGWLLGYIYLGNALSRADHDAWAEVYQSLPETARADLTHNNEYWRQFQQSAAKKTSNAVYDRFLKSYGQEKGLQTYGTVVDLLVVYYRDRL